MQKKKVALIVIFCFIVTSFVSIETPAELEETTQVEEIIFWYIDNDNIDDTMLGLIDDFETESGITVNITRLTPDTAKDEIKTALQNTSMVSPHIFQGKANWIAELVTNDYIQVLDADVDFQSDFMPRALREVSYYEIIDDVIQGGSLKYYGFPQYVDVQAYIYNTDKAAEANIPAIDASWTTADFKDAITDMNDQSDPNNKEYGFSIGDMPYAADPLLYGIGGLKFSDYIVDRGHNQIESNDSIDGLQLMYDMVNTYRLTPEDFSQMGTSGTYNKFAVEGNLASTFSFSSQIKHILAGSVFSDSSKLGIAPTPVDEDGKSAPLHVQALMVSKGITSEERSAAVELAQKLTSSEAMESNAEHEYLLPAMWSTYDNLNDNRFISSYKTLVQQASAEPISKYWDKLMAGYSTEVKEMLNGLQNGEQAARAIGIRWNFLLPASVGNPPIQPSSTTFQPSTSTTTSSSSSSSSSDSITQPTTSPWFMESFLGGMGIITLAYLWRRRRKSHRIDNIKGED